MSQFLTRLIARNLGTLAVIRPRLPSVYEPYRERGGAVTMPFNAEFREMENVEAGPSASPVEEIAEPSAALARQSRGSQPDSQPVEDIGERKRAVPGNSMLFPGRRFSQPRPQGAPANYQRNLAQIGEAEERLPVPALVSPAASEPPLALDPETSIEFSRSSPERDITKDPPRGPILRSSGSSHQPVAKVPHTNSASPRLGTEEPSVHVTIGRVDVRAVVPETPVSRPTPARSRPHLSLDDYLRQRDRGER